MSAPSPVRFIFIVAIALAVGCSRDEPSPPAKGRSAPAAKSPPASKSSSGAPAAASKGEVPAGMIGTWEWKNPLGEAELKLGIFPDKHVIFHCDHCPDDSLKIYQGEFRDGLIDFPEFMNNTEQLMKLLLMDRETLIAVSINAQGNKEATAMVWIKVVDDPWRILKVEDERQTPATQKAPPRPPAKGAAPATPQPQAPPKPKSPQPAPPATQSKTAPPTLAPAAPAPQPKSIPPATQVPSVEPKADPASKAPAPATQTKAVGTPPKGTTSPLKPGAPAKPTPTPTPKRSSPPAVQLP